MQICRVLKGPYLPYSNKECPTCRKKLISKRSLRSDPNFEALINKVCLSRALRAHSSVVMNA